MNFILEWIRTNWNEESNVGKAKLGTVAALFFLLIASLLPDSGREPVPVSPSVSIDNAAGSDAARQAAEAYASYEARVGELERETQAGAGEAAETYASYEARVAELERVQQALRGELAAKDLRIAELERRLEGAEASGDADGEAAGTANMELRLQLEAMRAALDQLLKKLE